MRGLFASCAARAKNPTAKHGEAQQRKRKKKKRREHVWNTLQGCVRSFPLSFPFLPSSPSSASCASSVPCFHPSSHLFIIIASIDLSTHLLIPVSIYRHMLSNDTLRNATVCVYPLSRPLRGCACMRTYVLLDTVLLYPTYLSTEV